MRRKGHFAAGQQAANGTTGRTSALKTGHEGADATAVLQDGRAALARRATLATT